MADVHLAWLDLDRARLNFLSMDLISSNAGYDHCTVQYGDGGTRLSVTEGNLRQAVDRLATYMYGPEWHIDFLPGGDYAAVVGFEHPNEQYGGLGLDEEWVQQGRVGKVLRWERFPEADGTLHQSTPWTEVDAMDSAEDYERETNA